MIRRNRDSVKLPTTRHYLNQSLYLQIYFKRTRAATKIRRSKKARISLDHARIGSAILTVNHKKMATSTLISTF